MTFTPGKLACLLFLVAICAPEWAQEPTKPRPSPIPLDEGDVIRINTNVVQVDASVLNKNVIMKRLKVQARDTAYTGRKEAQK